jgi:hypothetical protein
MSASRFLEKDEFFFLKLTPEIGVVKEWEKGDKAKGRGKRAKRGMGKRKEWGTVNCENIA